jgi:hypothetical protein
MRILEKRLDNKNKKVPLILGKSPLSMMIKKTAPKIDKK